MDLTPTNGLLYAQEKVGKTVALMLALPDADFVAEKNSIEPLAKQIGFPKAFRVHEQIGSLKQATDFVRKRDKKDKRPLVIDDLTLITDRTIAAHPNQSDMRAVYRDVLNSVKDLREACREAGIHLWANCHLREPSKDDSGTTKPGGPALPGKSGSAFAAGVQCLIRAERTESKPVGWPVMIRLVPSDRMLPTGDRLGVFFDRGPLNIREFLISAGYRLSTLPEFEWTEDIITAVAEEALALDATKTSYKQEVHNIIERYTSTLGESFDNPWWIAYPVMSGLDRATILRRKQKLNTRVTDLIFPPK